MEQTAHNSSSQKSQITQFLADVIIQNFQIAFLQEAIIFTISQLIV